MGNETRDITEYSAVCDLFSALSSPVRAAIVHEISEQPRTVGELVEAVGLSQPLVSQHLRVLRDAHLVSATRQGRSMLYGLVDEHVAHVFLDALTHTKETCHDHSHTHSR
ncbi:ArsR/SmtB family transcription factor [Devriesea agamarum]|uniref:ArsR/SmtB family transcription factor n=1 Tax=Devriesea agamarum TaxID=472569 RepID=UPI00071DDD10|nr:metalloregulator ArsR/SmtB family transcription factor [Devriesea agamarum]